MKSLLIDFAPRSVMRMLIQTRVITWLFGFLGIALCISALIALQTILQTQRIQQESRQRAQSRLAARQAAQPVVPPFAIADARADAINGAIAQLNLPWRGVFSAIETATPPTIALIAFEPDAKKQVLRGTAEAHSANDMVAYITRLKRQGFFGNVVLTKHEINEQDPNKPIRFQFEAQWSPSLP